MTAAKHAVVPLRQRAHAKAMRGKMTEPERRLWRALRQRLPIEASHFRRQVPIDRFIVDFCCLGAKLVVEVDGNQHGTDEARERDARRTALIEAQGFRVLRFSNFEIMRALDSVLDTIFAAAAGTPTPSPPHKGEGGILDDRRASPASVSPPPYGEWREVGVADEAPTVRNEHPQT